MDLTNKLLRQKKIAVSAQTTCVVKMSIASVTPSYIFLRIAVGVLDELLSDFMISPSKSLRFIMSSQNHLVFP